MAFSFSGTECKEPFRLPLLGSVQESCSSEESSPGAQEKGMNLGMRDRPSSYWLVPGLRATAVEGSSQDLGSGASVYKLHSMVPGRKATVVFIV